LISSFGLSKKFNPKLFFPTDGDLFMTRIGENFNLLAFEKFFDT